MSKLTVVVSCPIDTYSGYGARARDFVKALVDLDRYDVKVLSQRWGNTRFGYLIDHKEEDLRSLIVNKIDSKPDIWIQITVPNEFQKVGTYNIGVTAGIETTICDASWIDGCNRMDLVLTSSKHSKDVFTSTVYDRADPKTKQPLGEVKLTTPVEILFEGADLSKYFVTKTNSKSEIVKSLNTIKEDFCYLVVGHWMQGDLGQDRKNIGYTIKAFLETFKNQSNTPALILKTHQATTSLMDQNRVLEKIDRIRRSVKGKLPNIYLLHGEITDAEMNQLYNHKKVKAMVSLTKGEGFGRPLLEFSLVNKPIIASGWSAQVDFLQKDFTGLVGGTLTKVHPSAVQPNVLLAESSWFTPSDSEVFSAFRVIKKDYKKFSTLAKRQGHYSRTNFSYEGMVELLGTILDKNIPNIPKQVELNLPKLDLPKL
jgi:hypothetical protein